MLRDNRGGGPPNMVVSVNGVMRFTVSLDGDRTVCNPWNEIRLHFVPNFFSFCLDWLDCGTCNRTWSSWPLSGFVRDQFSRVFTGRVGANALSVWLRAEVLALPFTQLFWLHFLLERMMTGRNLEILKSKPMLTLSDFCWLIYKPHSTIVTFESQLCREGERIWNCVEWKSVDDFSGRVFFNNLTDRKSRLSSRKGTKTIQIILRELTNQLLIWSRL